MTRTGLLLTIPCLFAYISLHAQIPGMKVFGVSDGYPANIGYIITQDSTGFIWVGSNNGVIRYDGHSFEVLDDRDGLPDKEIIEAIPVSRETVLINPLVNHICYYRNGRVINENSDSSLALINNKTRNRMEKDEADQSCWIGDSWNTGGLFRFRKAKLQWVDIPLNKPFSIHSAWKNTLVLSDGDTPLLYRADEGSLQHFHIEGDPSFFRDGTLRFTHDHSYVVAYQPNTRLMGVYRFRDPAHLEFIAAVPAGEMPKQMILDHKNRLWFTYLHEGLLYWGPVPMITANTRPIRLLENTVVNDVFSDRDENLWFTTQRKGLYFIPASQWANHLRCKKTGLPEYTPLSLYSNGNDRLYMIYEGQGAPGYICQGYFKTMAGTPGEELKGLNGYQDQLYTFSNTQVYHQVSDKLAQPLLDVKTSASAGVIKDISIDAGGKQLLIASSMGMYSIPVKGGIPAEHFSLRTTCVLAYKDQVIIGTPNGLYHGTKQNYLLSCHPVLARANISDMVKFDDQKVLIATGSDGLFMYDPHLDSAFALKRPKLYMGTINQVYTESKQQVWLATDQGVFNLSLKGERIDQVRQYTFRNGLPSNHVTSVWCNQEHIYATTSSGLGIIPRETLIKTSHSTVAVLKAGSEKQSFYNPHQLDFEASASNIYLRLSSFNYENLGKTSYRYTLEDYYDRWYNSPSQWIQFTDLPPGKYLFKVRPIGPNGENEGAPVSIPLVKRPTFWQTITFRLIMGLAVTGFLIGLLYLVMFRQKQRAYLRLQQKRKLAELELEAIKAQINPHFIFNCLNSIQYLTYQGNIEDAQQYLDCFSLLIRQTMRLSQQIFTTLEDEIRYLTNYLKLEQMRFKEKLEYTLHIQENINPLRIIPAMLLQPYLENAIKHGIAPLSKSGRLTLSLREREDEWLEVTIHDNGPGFQPQTEKKANSLGMRLSGSRIHTYNELFNLDIRMDIQSPPRLAGYPALGTLIQILIPSISHEKIKV
ncbi:MAG: hypothetical protein CMI36_15285 [Owenweeksia sp.]|nr:hypothetical protein [Owenweeksia sp.]MBG00355.1 hypothetical protein [Owenweeksia sp.]|tara:strand:- start:2387 stop:5335 length:2949 start_codon:yes stop_codon:yes gene_type:complete